MAIMAAAAIVGAGISIYSAVDAKNKEKKAERGLDEWNKTHSQEFKTGQQIYDEAKATTPSGYSPAEKAAFEQSMARRSNAARRIATDRNPNLSGAINAGINYGNIQGLLQFAASDAAVRRNLISEKAGLIRGQSNAQTQYNQNVAGQYGQAIQQQRENFTSSMYNVANSAGALGYYYGDVGGGAGTGKVAGPTAGTTQTTGAPLRTAANPSETAVPGSDQWARNLYGNPVNQPYQPQFYGQAMSVPLGAGTPSAKAPGYQPIWNTNQYFTPIY